MTDRPIRTLAQELAAEFYEHKGRSNRFRSMDEPTRARALKLMQDGTIQEVTVIVPFRQAYPDAKTFSKSHWPFFYSLARDCLVAMLAMPDSRIHPNMKEAIKDAIVEDRMKQLDGAPPPELLQLKGMVNEPRK